MGNITDSIASAFRDFVTDGVASSGLHEPVKAEVRALGPLIETAIGNAGLGALVGVTKTTKALLDADLAHAADTVALVYADATDTNNDLYVKTGASGSGAWNNTGIIGAVLSALGSPIIDSAEASAAAAAASAASLNDRISQVDFLREDLLVVFRDANGGVFGKVGLDAIWDIVLAALKTGDFQIVWEERIGYDWPIVLLDGAGKLLWNAPAPSALSLDEEIAAARGDQAALNDRLSAALDDYGLRREQVSFRHNLRQTLAYFGNAAMGVAGQFRISAIGDSWTRTNDRWVQRFVEYLEGEVGLAAPGWVGFGRTFSGDAASVNGSWNWTDYPLVRTGTWTDAYNTSPASPDRSHATSNEVGASQTVSGTALPALSGADLYWIGTADGVVEYRWNATGAWNSLNVQGTVGAVSWAAITIGMLVSGAWSIEVRVVSGAVTLCGIEFKGAGNGIHFNKFGGAGANISHWATAGNYGDAYGQMNPNLFIIMDGTNSQAALISPASWGAQLESLIDGIRADCLLADILVMMPSENLRTNSIAMSAYADEGRRIAYEKGCGFLDHCFTFGADTSVYGPDGLKWFDADPIHCTAAGYRALASATLRTIGAL